MISEESVEMDETLKNGIIEFIMKMCLVFGEKGDIICEKNRIRRESLVEDENIGKQIEIYNSTIWKPYEEFIFKYWNTSNLKHNIRSVKTKYDSVFLESDETYDTLHMKEWTQVSYWAGEKYVKDPIITPLDYSFEISG